MFLRRSDTRLQRFRAGASYRNTGGAIHYLDRIIINPGNLENSYVDNIAIARLATSLIFTPSVQPTAIPPQGTVIPDGLPVTQAGWGTTQVRLLSSDVITIFQI